MLSLSLLPRETDGEDTFVINIKWARRDGRGCDGLRTVELRQTVALPERETVALTADGGLRVELRRRS
ncbi:MULTISPECIES: hypothetical protein [unclassified Sphingomonas]|uniref:hypothetical protein n=1 Tax=unclassified Sphingomonas TaxID=196159 RepID=UPI001D10E0FB|nr:MULTISPECIES: hypothetical protein [unclassified Sphingomonas]MCC2979107.1 hypothetical protein [Sphingomonas sp. IC4-52]MCD2315659.1 hypothetical protein [Sphingomonas sp. IC-11]